MITYQLRHSSTFCWCEPHGRGELSSWCGRHPYHSSLPGTVNQKRSVISLSWKKQNDGNAYFVGANTASFKSFRWKLFVLIGDQVNAEREIFYASLLATQVENTDLRIGDTTVESWFWVRLILTVTVAVIHIRNCELVEMVTVIMNVELTNEPDDVPSWQPKHI